MKNIARNMDYRSLITYVGLGMVGLFLLLLVTTNFTGRIGFMVTSNLFFVLPLIILIALATLIFGKSKRATKPASPQISKVIGISAAMCIVLSLVSTYVSTRLSVLTAGTHKFVYENVGVGLLFAAYTGTLILMSRQNFIYWPFWNTKDKKHADEREKAVRYRVFENSYRLNILLVIVGLWLARISSQRMHHELYQTAILCFLGLPSIIASWQKDS